MKKVVIGASRQERALKQMSDNFDALFEPEDAEPCAECGAEPGAENASW